MRLVKLLKRISDSAEIEVINKRANIVYKGKAVFVSVEDDFKVGRIEARGSRIYIYERSDFDAKKQVFKHNQNGYIQNFNLDG